MKYETTGVPPDPDGIWPCEAYGPEGVAIGALCFFSAGERLCASLPDCQAAMAAERCRVFQRINELAADGRPDFADLAEEFPTPERLLNGDEAGS